MNESIITFLEAIQKQPGKRYGFCLTYQTQYTQTRVSDGYQCDLCGELVPFEEPYELSTRLDPPDLGTRCMISGGEVIELPMMGSDGEIPF